MMNIKKMFLKYASLSMMSMIGMSCYILADTLFIANGVGPLGLTSLNLVLPIYNLIFGIGLMLGVGGATRFSILQSQNKNEGEHYFSQTLSIAIFISIPFIILGLCFPERVVSWMGGNQEVMPIAAEYLRTFIIFTPFFIGNYIVVTFVRNDHDPTLASIAMLAGTLFNIVFDYVFIFPCHLGMFGAALATGCSPILSILICSFHFRKRDNHLKFIRQNLNYHDLFETIQVGIPSFVSELSSGIVTYVFNMVVFRLGGNIAIASYGIICNLAIVVISLYNGIAQGIQPLMSQCFGRRDSRSIQQYLHYAIIFSLIISCLIYGFVYLCPDMIISFFNNEGNLQMIEIAKTGLIIYFSGFFFAGMNMIYVSYFTSIQEVKSSFLISILRGGLIIIPLVFLLSIFYSLIGVWLSYPVSECFVFICIVIFMKHKQSIN